MVDLDAVEARKKERDQAQVLVAQAKINLESQENHLISAQKRYEEELEKLGLCESCPFGKSNG